MKVKGFIIYAFVFYSCNSNVTYDCFEYIPLNDFEYCDIGSNRTYSQEETGTYNGMIHLKGEVGNYKYNFNRLIEFCCLYLDKHPEIVSNNVAYGIDFFSKAVYIDDRDESFYRRYYLGGVGIKRIKNTNDEYEFKLEYLATFGFKRKKIVFKDEMLSCKK
jgi:hypothetical protein